jgi:hypothetical protein
MPDTDDLISLADAASPTVTGSKNGKLASASRQRNGAQRDSFSDLVGAMKAKKPYPTSSAASTPKSGSFSATNGKSFLLQPNGLKPAY